MCPFSCSFSRSTTRVPKYYQSEKLMLFKKLLSLLLKNKPLSPKWYSVSSVAQSCLTLCDPMNHSTPGLPVHHQLPESTQSHVHWVGDAIQPSHPLSSPSPALSLSQHQGLFQWVSSSHQVAKVSVPYGKDKGVPLTVEGKVVELSEIIHFRFSYDLVIKSLKLLICLLVVFCVHYNNKEL